MGQEVLLSHLFDEGHFLLCLHKFCPPLPQTGITVRYNDEASAIAVFSTFFGRTAAHTSPPAINKTREQV